VAGHKTFARGFLRHGAMSSACRTTSVVWRLCIAQPTTRREKDEDEKTIRGIVFLTTINDHGEIGETFLFADRKSRSPRPYPVSPR